MAPASLDCAAMRAAVVGHVEWIEFARVDARAGRRATIVHAHEVWEEPGGGGAVAAVQLAKLAGAATFFTALGDDELGHRAKRELEALGLRGAGVLAAPSRSGAASCTWTRAGERTITVIGDRLGPRADDPLPWDELRDADAVYFTAGDAGAVRARAGRAAAWSPPRAASSRWPRRACELDALVASAHRRGRALRAGPARPEPRAVVRTAGRRGRQWEPPAGTRRLGGRAAARAGSRRLRLRRQLRGRAHLRPRAPDGAAGGAASRRSLRRGMPHRAAARTRASSPPRRAQWSATVPSSGSIGSPPHPGHSPPAMLWAS